MSTPPKKLFSSPWARGTLIVCTVLSLTVASIALYKWVNRYANRVVENRVAQIPVSITLAKTPPWLHDAILNDILTDAVNLARRDDAMFQRFQNPTDTGIYDEIRAAYAANQSRRSNAWIKKINRIQRVQDQKNNVQRIEIFAEYRQPVAWVYINGKYVLIDEEFVRLPGDYSDADRRATGGFLTITGLAENLPDPGRAFSGPELPAALKIADLLKNQNFARQIDLINVANFRGRKDPLAPQIVLETVFRTAGNKPRAVYWGRPLGEEKFWEVSAPVKLQALQKLYLQYKTIDAGRDYVDIRTEQVRVPKLASEVPAPITPRG